MHPLFRASQWVFAAAGVLLSSAPVQETAAPGKVDAAELVGLRMVLSGPENTVYVWAASEWRIAIDNGTAVELSCGRDLFGPMNFGGARITFEVASGGQAPRGLVSNEYLGHPGRPVKTDFLVPGRSVELPVVLHGEMVLDFDAYARGDEVDTRFTPAFESAGPYAVTAVLNWNGRKSRSNPVALTVAEAPPGSEQALAELKRLAEAGICVDVQGMHRLSWPDLELVAAFVESEPYTLYGAQLRVGFADALLRIVLENAHHHEAQPNKPPLPCPISATLARVKSLLAQEPPVGFGLERSLLNLRERIAEG